MPEGLHPAGGTHTGSGAECEESSPEEEETTWDELTTAPIPRPPALLGGEKVEKSGVKLSLGGEEGWGEGVLRFGFTANYSTLI